jgi:hypothetical protein
MPTNSDRQNLKEKRAKEVKAQKPARTKKVRSYIESENAKEELSIERHQERVLKGGTSE